MMEALGYLNYWIYILLMMIGLYAVIVKPNLIRRVIGLGIFQTAIFLFFISVGKIDEGTAPVRISESHASTEEGHETPDEKAHSPAPRRYSNPLTHALILTAIVVSVSTMAVALAIIINIKRSYRTIEADEIERIDLE
jgi:multicomponent Na+:H+ antiporter subunit C